MSNITINFAPGTAIQIGLMALVGSLPYEPDWIVQELRQSHSPQDYYRFHVRGINLNFAPDETDYRFSWSVRDLGWRFAFPFETYEANR